MRVPVLQVRHKDPAGWVVAAKWPDGRIQEIGNFPTESEANKWISQELQSWVTAGSKEEIDDPKQ